MVGPPGSGKSSVSRMLADSLQLDVFRSGDVLRSIAARSQRTPFEDAVKWHMDRSLAMPIAVYQQMIRQELIREHARGVVFDGFPRTAEQSRAVMDTLQAVAMQDASVTVVVLYAAKHVLYRRIAGRAVCETCRTLREPGRRCCSDPRWRRRADDAIEVFTVRYDEYTRTLQSIVDGLCDQWPCHYIDASSALNEVASKAVHFVQKGIVTPVRGYGSESI